MKILVPIKRVLDFSVRPRVKPDGSGIDLGNTKMTMNPFDEIALEQAVQLKEAGHFDEVVIVSIGPRQTQDILRTGLAAGADRGLLIQIDDNSPSLEPLGIAKVLRAVVMDEQPRMVICGKQAIDDDMNATGQMLAGLLGWPQATFASMIKVEADGIEIGREVDGGTQALLVELPAVVTADLRLAMPRFASLPNILKARSKPLIERSLTSYGLDLTPRLEVLNTAEPPVRRKGVRVASVGELADRLRDVMGAS